MKNIVVCLALAACAVGCASASVMSQQDWQTCAEDAKTGNEAAVRAKSWSESAATLYGIFGGFFIVGGVFALVGAVVPADGGDTTIQDTFMTVGGLFMGVSLLDLLFAIPVDLQAATYGKAWLDGIGTGKAVTHATQGPYGRFVPDRRGGFRFLREDAKAALPAGRS